MNLWANGRGLLALFMLLAFFSSCEEEENTIGLPVENQLELKYLEYNVPVEMVWTDSVISQEIGVFYSGQFDLEEAGVIRAVPYISFVPQRYDSNINLPAGAVLKEFYLQLDYVSDLSGPAPSEEALIVYQLADTINNFVAHTINDKQDLGNIIGRKTFTYYPDSLTYERTKPDSITFNYIERIDLDKTMGANLFNKLLAEDENTFGSKSIFEEAFKGLAIVPGDNNSVLMGLSSSQTRVIFSYEYTTSNGTVTTGQFAFFPSSKYYHNITPNASDAVLTGSAFQDLPCCYQGYTPAGDMVYQVFGTGINIKLDLSAFQMFTDTLTNTIINSAVLELDDVKSTVATEDPPAQISFFLTTSEGKRTKTEIQNINYFRTLPSERIGEAPVRIGDPVVLNYDKKQEFYRANITLFLNHLLQEPEAPAFLLLESTDIVPQVRVSSLRRSAKTVGAIQVIKESIKVRVYYSTVD